MSRTGLGRGGEGKRRRGGDGEDSDVPSSGLRLVQSCVDVRPSDTQPHAHPESVKGREFPRGGPSGRPRGRSRSLRVVVPTFRVTEEWSNPPLGEEIRFLPCLGAVFCQVSTRREG